MKRIKLFLIIIGLSIVLAGVGLYGYLHSLTPKPSGQIALQGLNQEVEVFFDKFGIPHIYGQNEEDVYFALGYVHARERLFQMEMMRRVPAGRLSEILGKDLLETDRFFRILGLNRWAEQAAEHSKTCPNLTSRRPWPTWPASTSSFWKGKNRSNSNSSVYRWNLSGPRIFT